MFREESIFQKLKEVQDRYELVIKKLKVMIDKY